MGCKNEMTVNIFIQATWASSQNSLTPYLLFHFNFYFHFHYCHYSRVKATKLDNANIFPKRTILHKKMGGCKVQLFVEQLNEISIRRDYSFRKNKKLLKKKKEFRHWVTFIVNFHQSKLVKEKGKMLLAYGWDCATSEVFLIAAKRTKKTFC